MNIVVMPDAAERVSAAKVTLTAKDQPLAEALRDICREIGGATYEVQDEVVMIRAAAE